MNCILITCDSRFLFFFAFNVTALEEGYVKHRVRILYIYIYSGFVTAGAVFRILPDETLYSEYFLC